MSEWIKIKNDSVLISIRVQPGASRNEICGIKQGCLAIKLCSPPVEGRANDELVRFIAGKLKVPPTSIEIVQGLKSRIKVLAVPGISAEIVEIILSPLP